MAKKKTTPKKKAAPKKPAAKKVTPKKVVEPVIKLEKAPIVEVAETWRDRLVLEAKDLKTKMTALKTALDEGTVPTSERVILKEQYDAMMNYYIILNRRLSK